MNSESGQRLSVEELTALNRTQPAKMEAHPAEQEWAKLLVLQGRTNRLLTRIAEQLEGYPTPPDLYPVTERLAAMEKELTAIRQSMEKFEQAGRKNERRRLRLPRICFPELPTATLKGAILTLMALIVLAILLFILATVWNDLLKPFLALLR